MADELKLLKKQMKEYEQTLKWYANIKNFQSIDKNGYKAVERDEGSQARVVLRRWNER